MEKLYSVKEASRVLGYPMSNVSVFVRNGDLKTIVTKKGPMIPQSEIDRFLAVSMPRLSQEKIENHPPTTAAAL